MVRSLDIARANQKRGEGPTPFSGWCRCRVRIHRLIFDSFTVLLTLHFANRNDLISVTKDISSKASCFAERLIT
jgi:hypothetical protein